MIHTSLFLVPPTASRCLLSLSDAPSSRIGFLVARTGLIAASTPVRTRTFNELKREERYCTAFTLVTGFDFGGVSTDHDREEAIFLFFKIDVVTLGTAQRTTLQFHDAQGNQRNQGLPPEGPQEGR
ncbi:uncharacterized protein LOC100118041 isoform X1 [Nasonia vitripennis]|uniref:Uncharacterized protein n=1 Tax=Nasonia vitripennis TaxID=7425 RepID=A0A7M7IS86_NASVI|nr:uncharacterized protein LOC100118041 isoform X1 [Nasonia vitripennis]